MGRIVHFEFATPDPAKETEFFSKVFDWKVAQWAENDYWLVTTGTDSPGIDGAIMPLAMPDQPRVVDTIAVDSIDDTIAKATEAGATLAVEKQEIPGMGWSAYLMSPTGILFGLFENAPGQQG